MLPAHMHTRANIIDHSFAIPLCLYHGWNKTHELGRDFDKICAPMPWERGKKKKERKKGRKGFDLLLHRKIFTRSGLKKKKKNSDPLKWLFVFTSWYGFQKKKKCIFATESEWNGITTRIAGKKKYHAIPYCAVTFESFISKKDINLILLTQINFYKCEICLR